VDVQCGACGWSAPAKVELDSATPGREQIRGSTEPLSAADIHLENLPGAVVIILGATRWRADSASDRLGFSDGREAAGLAGIRSERSFAHSFRIGACSLRLGAGECVPAIVDQRRYIIGQAPGRML